MNKLLNCQPILRSALLLSVALLLTACMTWSAGAVARTMLSLAANPDNTLLYPSEDEEPMTIRFPEVTGANLQGEPFSLPGGFAAPYNLVLLAYTQQQPYDVYTGLPLLEQLEADSGDVRYYELPTLPLYNPLFRAQIDYRMYAGIPDPETRARTITLYLDVDAFNRALGIENSEQMRLLLVTPQGASLRGILEAQLTR